jgi:hypothetical protein
MKNGIIIAKKNDTTYRCYVKGDTLRVIRTGVATDTLIAENLTRPHLTARDGNKAVLLRGEYESIPGPKGLKTKEIRVLGIPIYREYIKDCGE